MLKSQTTSIERNFRGSVPVVLKASYTSAWQSFSKQQYPNFDQTNVIRISGD